MCCDFVVVALCCVRAVFRNCVRGCAFEAMRVVSRVPCEAEVETYERLSQRVETFQQCSNFMGIQTGDCQVLAPFRTVAKKVQERSLA